VTAVKRLVLLTGEYPFGYGDVNFVRHEIDALAGAYDEVLVFNYARRAEEAIAMPANVRFVANLFERSRRRALLALVSPPALLILLRVLRREHAGGRLAGALRQTVLSSIQGMRIAGHPHLREALRSPSAVTSVYAFWGMGAALGLPWFRPVPAGTAVRVHRFDLYEDAGNLPLRLSLFSAADRILAISEDGRRYLLDRFAGTAGLDRKIVVSRLGTTDPGRRTRPQRSAHVATIVTCSSVIPGKRVARVADALGRLGEERTVRWVHFGDGPLLPELKSRVAGLGHPAIEIELRGATANVDVLDYLRNERVDVFVNVSESEGVPVSIMEAMSFGIPIVATAVGGTPEIVHPDLGSGELLPRDFTDQQLADQITRVLSAPDDRYDPRATWERFCDAARNSQTLVDLLAPEPARH
jgi:colanic acid/amylovoran biosynthesis glycosyltransferase